MGNPLTEPAAPGPASSKSAATAPLFPDDLDLLSSTSVAVGPSSSTEPLLNKPSAGDDDTLPSYSEFPASDLPPAFSKYLPLPKKFTSERSIIRDSHLCSDPEALYQWLLEQRSPFDLPQPFLKITGTHRAYRTVTRNNRSETEETIITDFDITISLSALLSVEISPSLATSLGAERRFRGTRTRVTDPTQPIFDADPEALVYHPYLRQQCANFTTLESQFKTWEVERRVPLNTATLEFHIGRIVRSTNYRGTLSVSFPVHNREMVIVPDGWVNRLRYSRWRYAFYVTMLWVLIWPVLWILTKRWAVVDVVCPVREGAEEEWVGEWGLVVRELVRNKRRGNVGLGELEGARESLVRQERERREGRGQRREGWFGWMDAFQEVGETVSGGWGGDEGGFQFGGLSIG